MFVERIDGTELRFKNPGWLLLVVISFVFWGIGLLDLIGHTSAQPDVLGRYSLPFFGLIVLYAGSGALWILLFINANILSRMVEGVRYVQNRAFLVIPIFVLLGVALWVMLEWDRWASVPGLQFSFFGQALLVALILLFANWTAGKRGQVWRKIIAYPLFALLILEGIVQLTAWFGALPGITTLGGHFYPFERVYYNGEFTRNGFANRYGWSFPDFNLDKNKKRILIVGGSFVQALQVQPEQQFGWRLSEMINQAQTEPVTATEIVSIGLPGFGLSPFLSEEYVREFPDLMRIDEIVVAFHLGDDFQSPVPTHNPVRFNIIHNNDIEIHPDDARLRHDLTHYYLRAYMGPQLVETVRSNYLTPKLISSLVNGGNNQTMLLSVSTGADGVDFPRMIGYVQSTYALNETDHAGIKETGTKLIPQGNNFMFSQDAGDRNEAVVITEAMLKKAQEITREAGITLRIVTIPVFPDAFYKTYPAGSWEPVVEGYDLFLPEKELLDIANQYDISILPMGQTMLKDGLSVEEIKAFYLPGSQNSLTTYGHEYFAKAIFSEFYQGND